MNLSEIYEQYKINNSIAFRRKGCRAIFRIKPLGSLENYFSFDDYEDQHNEELYIVIDWKFSRMNRATKHRFEILQPTLLYMIADDYEILEGP